MEKLNLPLPEGFLQEEVRCGYTVTEKMKKIWAIEMDLLVELLRVCQKYDLKVFASFGTLLGAVRHNGFIPWDDDMDVYMLREDYEILESVAEKEFQAPYFLQTPLSDREFFSSLSRLRNDNTTGKISFYDSPTYHSGIYIDINILDGYCTDDKKRLKQVRDRSWIEHFIHCYYANIKKQRLSKKIIYTFVQPLLRAFVPYERLIQKYRAIMKRYSENAEFVSPLYYEQNGKMLAFPRHCFEEMAYHDFEFIQVPIPQSCDEILRLHYGDFMRLPPVEERGTWHNETIEFDPDTPWREYVQKMQHGK